MPNCHKDGPAEEASVGFFFVEGSLQPEECGKISSSDLFYTTTESLTDTEVTV